MSDEKELFHAHMEADRNEAEEAYFDARPGLANRVSRHMFRAGYERAYTKLWPLARMQIDEPARAELETRACQHDLLAPDPTATVDPSDPFAAYCDVCDYKWKVR